MLQGVPTRSGPKRRGKAPARTSRGPQGLPTQASSTQRPTRQRKPYVLPQGPRGDAPQTRKVDQRKAAHYKHSNDYAKSIRAAYGSMPPAERAVRTHLAKARVGTSAERPEDRIIVREHNRRLQGNANRTAAAEKFTGLSSRETRRIDAYNQRQAAKPKHSSLLGSILHAGEHLATGAFHAAYPSVKHVKAGTPGASTRIGAVPTLASATASGVGSIPGKAVKNTAIAEFQSPGKTTENTLKGARDSLVGIPGAAVGLLTNPKGTAKSIANDYARRYGPLVSGGAKGEKQFRQRIKKEGFFPEAADLVTAAVPSGAVVGRVAGAAARAGSLGVKAERIATEARPALRVTGGAAKEQPLSRNLIVAAVQKSHDAARGKVQAKRALPEDAPALVRVAQKRGEVTPIRRGAADRAQHRMVAKAKGRALHQMKAEQAQEVHKGLAREHAHLTKDERAAVKVTTQLGLPADPKVAVRELKTRRNAIIAQRATRKDLHVGRSDELPVIDHLIANAEKAFTPQVREVVDSQNARLARAAHGDPGVAVDQAELRRVAAQAEHLGLVRHEGENAAQFVSRVDQSAAHRDLLPAGYFKSEKRPAGVFSSFAVGGNRAVAAPKKYTGELFRTGRESNDPQVVVRALAQNIKRKHNWNLIAHNFDAHVIHDLGSGSIQHHLDNMERQGIDPGSVAFWNPGRYAAAHKSFTEHAPNDVTHGMGEEPVAQGVGNAVQDSTATVKDLLTKPADFKTSDGWYVVAKGAHDEISADTKPSGKVGRGFDVFKGKQSRVLLGLSPAWLQFQIASNGLLTGLAGTGPVDVVKAQAWWRRLDPAQRQAVEPYLGIGHFQGDIQQTKMGAAANGNLINAYRALKETPMWRKAGKANPLDALFRIDNAQNNFFRKSVLYSQVKRDAYRQMGHNAGQAMGLQSRLVNILQLGPEDQMSAILHNQSALEKHAQHVNDFLGDYTTYTAKERRTLGRAVMFYGFLRYSLRFTFWTMPLKHPVMAAIISNLGRLQTDEVRKILGGNELPYALGKFYWTSGGKLKAIDLSRANPALNAATQINLRDPKSLIGMLPPVVVAAADQVYGKSSFTGKPFRVQGETAGRKTYGLGDRARIFGEQMLQLAAPYRSAEHVALLGPQGNDSMLFSPRPTQYKDPTIRAGVASDVAAEKTTGSIARRALQQAVPFIPRDSRDPQVAASIRAGKKQKGSSGGGFDFSTAKSGGPKLSAAGGGGFDFSTAKAR